MADLYASAIGTTMLQLKELPPRPPEYDGKLCLFALAEGVDEAAICAALAPAYGEIVRCTLGDFPPAVVCFTTHEAALAAKRAAALLEHIAGGVDTLFNERAYDERGWCVFEWSVSGELILRLRAYPRMRAALDALPPKVLALRSGCPLEPIELTDAQLDAPILLRLADGTIRLIRCDWLLSTAAEYYFDRDRLTHSLIVRRKQDLPNEAVLPASEATRRRS